MGIGIDSRELVERHLGGKQLVTRFAPSPTGLLHVGHAFSAMLAFQLARSTGGQLLLRIEDIDGPRSKPEFEAAIYKDLQWLGIDWDGEVLRQSTRKPAYEDAIAQLRQRDVLYPCFCNRREINEELETLVSAPHTPAPVYGGRCSELSKQEIERRVQNGELHALRLDLKRSLQQLGKVHGWDETDGSHHVLGDYLRGDEVIARKDIGISYHLASVVDDAHQGVNVIVRGEDIRESTAIHRVLQDLLGFSIPIYEHHCLISDGKGERLAKRRGSESLASLRESGVRPEDLWEQFGLERPLSRP